MPGWPKRSLAGQGVDHGGVIEDIDAVVESSKASLVGEKLGEGDFPFSALRELRPELRDRAIERDPPFLQNVEKTGAPEAFRGRPEEDEGVGGPGDLALGIAEAVVEIEDGLAVLPDGNGRAELAELFEIFFEERGEACGKRGGVEWHCGHASRKEGRFPKRLLLV